MRRAPISAEGFITPDLDIKGLPSGVHLVDNLLRMARVHARRRVT